MGKSPEEEKPTENEALLSGSRLTHPSGSGLMEQVWQKGRWITQWITGPRVKGPEKVGRTLFKETVSMELYV